MADMTWVGPKAAADALKVAVCTLKRYARRGILPAGAVRATAGGHYRYNRPMLIKWSEENYERQTKMSRLRERQRTCV